VSSDLLGHVKDQVLEVGKDDYVGLWQVLSLVHQAWPSVDDRAARQLTQQIIKELLDSKSVAAGFPAMRGAGFEPWDGPTETILARISDEWDRLASEPNIGEVVWLTAL